jgi:hypothetical protein
MRRSDTGTPFLSLQRLRSWLKIGSQRPVPPPSEPVYKELVPIAEMMGILTRRRPRRYHSYTTRCTLEYQTLKVPRAWTVRGLSVLCSIQPGSATYATGDRASCRHYTSTVWIIALVSGWTSSPRSQMKSAKSTGTDLSAQYYLSTSISPLLI